MAHLAIWHPCCLVEGTSAKARHLPRCLHLCPLSHLCSTFPIEKPRAERTSEFGADVQDSSSLQVKFKFPMGMFRHFSQEAEYQTSRLGNKTRTPIVNGRLRLPASALERAVLHSETRTRLTQKPERCFWNFMLHTRCSRRRCT